MINPAPKKIKNMVKIFVGSTKISSAYFISWINTLIIIYVMLVVSIKLYLNVMLNILNI